MYRSVDTSPIAPSPNCPLIVRELCGEIRYQLSASSASVVPDEASVCKIILQAWASPPRLYSSVPNVFVDLDGVVVDYRAMLREIGEEALARGQAIPTIKDLPGVYRRMAPIEGAIEAVRSVIGMGYVVHIASKPCTGVGHSYQDKALWVLDYLPELKRRLILTHDKGLLGSENDFLLDDRPHKAGCERFPGTLIRFLDGTHWPLALQVLRQRRGAAQAGHSPYATRWRIEQAISEATPGVSSPEAGALAFGLAQGCRLPNGASLRPLVDAAMVSMRVKTLVGGQPLASA